MPLISDNIPEIERDIDGAFSGQKSKLPGFVAVRRPTALVAEILRKNNNFFITGQRGLSAMDMQPSDVEKLVSPTIEVAGKVVPNPDFDAGKLMSFVPKIAEVIVLLTCTDDELDDFDEDPKLFKKKRNSLMGQHSSGEILLLMTDVQEEFNKINKSTAVIDDSEEELPSLKGSTVKKRVRPGSRTTR